MAKKEKTPFQIELDKFNKVMKKYAKVSEGNALYTLEWSRKAVEKSLAEKGIKIE